MTRLGLQLPSFTFPGAPSDRMFERVSEIANAAEGSGFDSFWVMPSGSTPDDVSLAGGALSAVLT